MNVNLMALVGGVTVAVCLCAGFAVKWFGAASAKAEAEKKLDQLSKELSARDKDLKLVRTLVWQMIYIDVDFPADRLGPPQRRHFNDVARRVRADVYGRTIKEECTKGGCSDAALAAAVRINVIDLREGRWDPTVSQLADVETVLDLRHGEIERLARTARLGAQFG